MYNYIGETGFGLSGSGELVRLFNNEDEIVDSLTYDDKDPWPTEADGDGSSLELIDSDLNNSIAENWKSSLNHGTPGRINSVIVTSIKENEKQFPDNCKLSQNYPNPFNPSTKIEYYIPVKSFVSLKVYDSLGREVAVLYEGFNQAGYHYVTFDGSYISSGVYFYKLQSDNSRIVKKLLLLK